MSQTREPPILRQRKNHLPDDVVLNILARLPVKSVLRFRCACKSWNSSITSPNFISTHLNININDNNGSLILMPCACKKWAANTIVQLATLPYHRTFPRISRLEIPLTFQSVSVHMVGSFNGLLCLFGEVFIYSRGFTRSHVYLWNPSIRKLKKLPDTCLSQLQNDISGFAYLSDSNDYKVVRISCCLMKNGIITKSEAEAEAEAEVYTLSSDSWRRVMLGPNVFISNIRDKSPAPFVNGALHWIICMSESVKEPPAAKILTFDVNSEAFGNIALPSVSAGISFLHLAVFKGNLALFEQSPCNPQYILVWVMRECGVWDRPFDASFKKGKKFLGFTRDGEFLFQTSNAIVSFDPETSQVNHVVSHSQCRAIVATFMESLVLLDKANIQSE